MSDIQNLTASLDLKQNLNIFATCKQFDDLNLILNIYDNSIQADLTNYNVRLRAMKVDKVPLIQEHIGININSNVVNIEADEQLTTTSGKTPIELQFIDKTTGKKKATFNLVLIVVPSTLEVDRTISTATYTLLEELENKLDQASDYFENIGGVIAINNELKDTTIPAANTANDNLESSIYDANASKLALNQSKINADDSKSALDLSITNANNSKSALELSKTSADNSKAALDESIEEANEFVNNHGDIINLDNRVTELAAQTSEIPNQYVAKITGKGLSTNDYDNTEKAEVAKVKNKADIIYVNGQIQNMNSVVQGFYNTVALLTSAFPSGNTNNYVVTADNYIYRWNGSAWVSTGYLFDSNGVADKTITARKTTFLKNIGNLFFVENAEQGKVLFSDGTFIEDANHFISEYVETNDDEIFIAYALPNFCWYDVNKNFISGFDGLADKTYIEKPINARYYRGSGQMSRILEVYLISNSSFIKFGESKALNHIYNFDELSLEDDSINTDMVKDESITLEKLSTGVQSAINKVTNIGFPKQLNMPHYVSSENYDNAFMSNYYFMGRWKRRTINGIDCMYTINHGSKILFKVKDTAGLSINFMNLATSGNAITIAIKIDGSENYIRNTVNNAPFSLNFGVDTREHYIEVIVAGIKDEDLVWNLDVGCAFTGVILDNPEGTIEPIVNKARVGLFEGDSITAGCWVYGHTNPGTDNGAEANYVEQCCKLLRCSNIRAGFSGVGVLTGGQGSVPPFIGYTDGSNHTDYNGISPIDYMYGSIAENSQKPDFIVVNLGTNDGSASDSDFQTAYENVINRIQQKHPGLVIFVMRPFNGTKANIVQTVATNCTNTVYVDTTGWGITYTDGIHPDLAGSITAGEKLANFLINYFGKSYFMI